MASCIQRTLICPLAPSYLPRKAASTASFDTNADNLFDTYLPFCTKIVFAVFLIIYNL